MSHSLEKSESVQKTILLAEDFKDNAFMMRRLLELCGYRAFIAEDGREAVEKALEIKPDLIILDVSLPVMTGFEACEVLKGNEKTRDIPIIFISAHDSEAFKERGLSLGGVRYFTKPVNFEEVLEFISPLLGTDDVETKGEYREVPPERTSDRRKAKDPYRLAGTVLNEKYELIEYTGGGGMGAVYRALRKIEGDIVAVKVLKPDVVARSPEYAELFERETENARSLDHPHIVKVFDSDKDDDLSYMVMEWVEGSSIEDVITQGQLSISQIISIFEQVCSAVASAHQRGIIHLDLKPANILLLDDAKPDDFVKVIDFGLSRLISKESGTTVTKFRGTHQYCAPEQFGGRVSHRSDIYSLGATLYHLLTGVIPFGTSYINAKIHPNLELPEIPSVTRQRDLPSAIDRVIRKALSKNPALRQQSATKLFEEFREAISLNSENLQAGALATDGQNKRLPHQVSQINVSTEVDAEGVKVLSRAIGIETLGGVFTKLIPEGTPLPCQISEIFSTAADNQTSVEIHVLTGLRPLAQQNLSLGKFRLTDIPPAPRGVPQIEVTFDVNIHGVLNVSARDINTGREQMITISSIAGLSKEEIKEIFLEANKHADAGTQKREETDGRRRIDYVSRALRSASTYPLAQELLHHLKELQTNVKQSGRGGEADSSLSEELNHLQGELNGLYKFSESDIASQMILREAQTLLLNLRKAPNPAEAQATGAADEKSDEDAEYSFVLDAARQVEITNRQRQWHTSSEGVSSARGEVKVVYASLERHVNIANEKLASAKAPMNIELERKNDDHFILRSGPYSLSVTWDCKSDSTLENSVLSVRGYKQGEKEEQYSTADYDIEMNRDLVIGWRRREQKERFISTDRLAQELLEDLVGHIRSQAMYGK